MKSTVLEPFLILVVGATGDWAKKEIWPAIFAIFCNKEFAPDTKFLGIGRKVKKADGKTSVCRYAFQAHVRDALPQDANPELVEKFMEHLYFYAANSDDADSWRNLKKFSVEIEAPENLLFGLSTPTDLVVPTIRAIKTSGVLEPLTHRRRKRFLMLEKPYGTSHEECKTTFSEATETFGFDNVFPVDHYLVKQMVLELGAQRRNIPRFNCMYRSKRLSRVFIIADEADCLEHRHETYQSMRMGVFADMVLGHLLPLSVWMAMYERAIHPEVTASYVREMQLDLVSGLKIKPLCWGQYTSGSSRGRNVRSYTDLGSEEYLKTPTFFACELSFSSGPLADVPFFIRTGKCLDKKHTEIRLVHKPLPSADADISISDRFIMYLDDGISVRQNLLVKEDAVRNSKPEFGLSRVSPAIGSASSGAGQSFRPYEKLITSAMNGNFKDFPSIGTVIALYEKADEIWEEYEKKVAEDLKLSPSERRVLIPYSAGSSGPIVDGFPDY
ncbi:MAG TPA: hypothetical protein PKA63_05860 [Oligoflexia bacterium]|nr:hypothetical protein [Oligoflexia bacterium]HMP48175.1 hypothetical protein [Oligoflexia bacterium]